MEGEGKKKDLQVWPPIDSLSAHETGKGNNDWAQTKGDKNLFFFLQKDRGAQVRAIKSRIANETQVMQLWQTKGRESWKKEHSKQHNSNTSGCGA